MMSSQTAYTQMVASAVPIANQYTDEKDGVIGWGMTEPMIRRWVIKHGFRADGDNCAMQRWLKAWLETGQIIRFKYADGTGGTMPAYWFTEIGYTAYSILEEESAAANLPHFYDQRGMINELLAKQLKVIR